MAASPWPGQAPWLGLLSVSFFPLSCARSRPPRNETKVGSTPVTLGVPREEVSLVRPWQPHLGQSTWPECRRHPQFLNRALELPTFVPFCCLPSEV